MISFNGDEVDCTLERDVAEEMVKLLFFVVVDVDDETIGVEVDCLTSFDGVEVNTAFFCKTED